MKLFSARIFNRLIFNTGQTGPAPEPPLISLGGGYQDITRFKEDDEELLCLVGSALQFMEAIQ